MRDVHYSAFEEDDCMMVAYMKAKVIRVPRDRIHQAKRWLKQRGIDCKVLPNDKQTGETPEDHLPRAQALKTKKQQAKNDDRIYRAKHEQRKELF